MPWLRIFFYSYRALAAKRSIEQVGAYKDCPTELLGIRYEPATQWLRKYSALTVDTERKSSEFVVPKMEKLQPLRKESTPAGGRMKVTLEVNRLLARWIMAIADEAEMPPETVIVRALAGFFNDAHSIGETVGPERAVELLRQLQYLDYMATAELEQ